MTKVRLADSYLDKKKLMTQIKRDFMALEKIIDEEGKNKWINTVSKLKNSDRGSWPT